LERRVILAILAMIVVALAPALIWPSPRRPSTRAPGALDTARPQASQPPAPAPSAPSEPAGFGLPPAQPSDTFWVTSRLYRFGFSSLGGQLVRAELLEYRSFAAGDSASRVQLVPAGLPFLVHRLVSGSDTASLSAWTFTPDVARLTVGDAPALLTLTAERGGARVTLRYRFQPDDYRFDVRGAVTGLGPTGAVLALGLGEGLRSVEADSADDYHHYAVVTKSAKTESRTFGSLDPGETLRLDGPFEWVGLKTKYFLLAALATEPAAGQFGGAVLTGGPRSGKTATRAAVVATMPVPAAGEWRYEVYAGPIEHKRLARLGHGLDDANPYGGFLRGIIHPVSIFVVNILLWLHERLGLPYGWVLVIFGVMVRVLLWPLNQKAMESSLRMQAVAPIMKDVQERYKGDPERLQREMMKLYKEHKVNPLGGCLPMLLPLPVLFALFFVFQNTIEFRGVPFFWLPDLSRHDPLFIIPVVMGLSMFAVSKIGQMGLPPTPQTKMMLYFLPALMTFMFLRFASGLNLYYTVQNIVSIPQQYLLAKRRARQPGLARPPDPKAKP
jgi:YidC/Oxa1 family membrane protein insertase